MKNNLKSALVGIAIGFANGLFGAGGGTIAVACLQKFLDVETHKSHATAIAIILPLSILSAFIYIGKAELNWQTILYVCIGGVIGGYIGAKLLNKLSSKWIHKIFGIFIIAAAIKSLLG